MIVNPEIMQARRRLGEALTAGLRDPVEICIATRSLRNAHARAGWNTSQSCDDFSQLERAVPPRASDSLSSTFLQVAAAILEGIGVHHQFNPPHIEPLVPFGHMADELVASGSHDVRDWLRMHGFKRRESPTSHLPASLAKTVEAEGKPQGRLAQILNAVGSFVTRLARYAAK
jgi:hypothetical protein